MLNLNFSQKTDIYIDRPRKTHDLNGQADFLILSKLLSVFFFVLNCSELGCNVPQGDWRTSLCVWVELCARRAELPALLKAADVLVTLPPKQKRQADNRC